MENADLLYEYFPLSLDDWYVFFFLLCVVGMGVLMGRRWGEDVLMRCRMAPVDAIYRPHVVHHTVVPPDLKAAQVKNKTKRYFSADD